MRIDWENHASPGHSISPTGITCLTWMPHIPWHHTSGTNIQPSYNSGPPPGQPQHVNSFIGPKPSKTRGFLAIGTESGVLGITVTDTDDQLNFEEQDLSRRYNYNLRGHHSRIQRCAWNSTMTKLASCDENGIIYVWVPNDERWSVELVNDRGLKVRDFNWSQNGQAALILYEDNFVLIGSANGQRIWSNTFLQQINCGAWAPTSRELVLGLENGQIYVYNDQGMQVTERQLLPMPIQRVAFSPQEHNWTLAVVSSSDQILFLNSSYDVELKSWQSSDPIRMIQWSNNGKMLAVVCKTGKIIILNNDARLIHSFRPPFLTINEDSTIAFTWAHNDEIMIVSSNGGLAVGRVQPDVPPLNNLVAHQLWLSMGRTAREAGRLGLPDRLTNKVKQFDRHVIRCRIPSYDRMCRFVCEPTFWRWYCTIVPIPRKSFHYMLCLEHLGGLVPILLGRQINRVVPQFIISLPPSSAFSSSANLLRGRHQISAGEHQVGPRWDFASNGNSNVPLRSGSLLSDSDPLQTPSNEETECGYSSTVGTEFTTYDDELALSQSTNQNQMRNTMWRRSKRKIKKFMSKRLSPRSSKASRMLCTVQSNLWCTRFKLSSPGIKDVPMTLANVVYKTSVLHLQPRQMTINLCDLRPLTKTLKEQGNLLPPPPSILQQQHMVRRFRSADSSPAEVRRNPTAIDEIEEEMDNEIAANNNEQVGQGVVSPATMLPPQQLIQQQLQQRYLTYAETRARLRERLPMHRMPVSQQGQNAAAQTGRRTRRLRFWRRAAEDQQPMILGEPQQLAGRRQAPNPPQPVEQPAIQQDQRLRQRHVRFHQNAQQEEADLIQLDEDPNENTAELPQNELMEEEKRLYFNLKSEFDGLCAAVNDKVAQMRSIADELDVFQQQSSSTTPPTATLPTMQKRRTQYAAHKSATTNDLAIPPKETLWQHRVESLDFIDDDADNLFATNSQYINNLLLQQRQPEPDTMSDTAPLVPSHSNSTIKMASSACSSPTKKGKQDLKFFDKLESMVATMHLTGQKQRQKEDKRPLLKGEEVDKSELKEEEEQQRKITTSSSQSTAPPTTVEQMRDHFRDIARKTAQIEETLNTNEIHGDLKPRIQRIKAILGDTTHAADLIEPSRSFTGKHPPHKLAIFDECGDEIQEIQSERGASPTTTKVISQAPLYETIRMSNKTPFWNDDSQVYQLDFGGRVTQESAKNFQIEFDHEQVMQFGRIENGAYTLDFCSPLSAVQAFGIALASITQRLK